MRSALLGGIALALTLSGPFAFAQEAPGARISFDASVAEKLVCTSNPSFRLAGGYPPESQIEGKIRVDG